MSGELFAVNASSVGSHRSEAYLHREERERIKLKHKENPPVKPVEGSRLLPNTTLPNISTYGSESPEKSILKTSSPRYSKWKEEGFRLSSVDFETLLKEPSRKKKSKKASPRPDTVPLPSTTPSTMGGAPSTSPKKRRVKNTSPHRRPHTSAETRRQDVVDFSPRPPSTPRFSPSPRLRDSSAGPILSPSPRLKTGKAPSVLSMASHMSMDYFGQPEVLSPRRVKRMHAHAPPKTERVVAEHDLPRYQRGTVSSWSTLEHPIPSTRSAPKPQVFKDPKMPLLNESRNYAPSFGLWRTVVTKEEPNYKTKEERKDQKKRKEWVRPPGLKWRRKRFIPLDQQMRQESTTKKKKKAHAKAKTKGLVKKVSAKKTKPTPYQPSELKSEKKMRMLRSKYKLLAHEEQHILRAFNRHDTNRNGFLTRDEARKCLFEETWFNCKVRTFEVEHLLSLMDEDHVDDIRFPEFKTVMAAWLHEQLTFTLLTEQQRKTLSEVFDAWDREKVGYIRADMAPVGAKEAARKFELKLPEESYRQLPSAFIAAESTTHLRKHEFMTGFTVWLQAVTKVDPDAKQLRNNATPSSASPPMTTLTSTSSPSPTSRAASSLSVARVQAEGGRSSPFDPENVHSWMTSSEIEHLMAAFNTFNATHQATMPRAIFLSVLESEDFFGSSPSSDEVQSIRQILDNDGTEEIDSNLWIELLSVWLIRRELFMCLSRSERETLRVLFLNRFQSSQDHQLVPNFWHDCSLLLGNDINFPESLRDMANRSDAPVAQFLTQVASTVGRQRPRMASVSPHPFNSNAMATQEGEARDDGEVEQGSEGKDEGKDDEPVYRRSRKHTVNHSQAAAAVDSLQPPDSDEGPQYRRSRKHTVNHSQAAAAVDSLQPPDSDDGPQYRRSRIHTVHHSQAEAALQALQRDLLANPIPDPTSTCATATSISDDETSFSHRDSDNVGELARLVLESLDVPHSGVVSLSWEEFKDAFHYYVLALPVDEIPHFLSDVLVANGAAKAGEVLEQVPASDWSQTEILTHCFDTLKSGDYIYLDHDQCIAVVDALVKRMSNKHLCRGLASALTSRKHQLRQCFRHMDFDGSGFMDVTELLSISRTITPQSQDEYDDIFQWLDANSDGQVSEEEFVQKLLYLTETFDDNDFNRAVVNMMNTRALTENRIAVNVRRTTALHNLYLRLVGVGGNLRLEQEHFVALMDYFTKHCSEDEFENDFFAVLHSKLMLSPAIRRRLMQRMKYMKYLPRLERIVELFLTIDVDLVGAITLDMNEFVEILQYFTSGLSDDDFEHDISFLEESYWKTTNDSDAVDGRVIGDANGDVDGDVDGDANGDVDGEAQENDEQEKDAAKDVVGEVYEDVDGSKEEAEAEAEAEDSVGTIEDHKEDTYRLENGQPVQVHRVLTHCEEIRIASPYDPRDLLEDRNRTVLSPPPNIEKHEGFENFLDTMIDKITEDFLLPSPEGVASEEDEG